MIIYFKIFYCNKTTSNKSKYFNKFLLASLILSLINICLSYVVLVVFSIILGFRWNNGCFIRNGIFMLIPLQRIVLYSFYIIRLNVTFKGSIFEISSNHIKIIIILLIITIGTAMLPTLVFAYLTNNFLCIGKYSRYHALSGLWYNIGGIRFNVSMDLNCRYITLNTAFIMNFNTTATVFPI